MPNGDFAQPNRRIMPSHGENPYGFQGLWDGVVEDDQDPEQLGRVKIRIFELHDESVPTDALPWALPCFPNAFVHLNNPDRNGGFFHVPPVDALVHVMFRHGDPEQPVWMGGWFPGNHPIRGREGYSNKQKRQVLYNGSGIPSCPTWGSLRGFRIELDDEAAEIRITTPKGHKITASDSEANEHGDCIKLEDHKGNYFWMHSGVDELKIYWNGDCYEHITGDYHRQVDGNEVRYVTGNVSEDYGGMLNTKQGGLRNVDAPTINHNCGKANPEPNIATSKDGPGKPSGGDPIQRVLAALGNIIKKIATG